MTTLREKTIAPGPECQHRTERRRADVVDVQCCRNETWAGASRSPCLPPFQMLQQLLPCCDNQSTRQSGRHRRILAEP
jgi:hypothetical protein